MQDLLITKGRVLVNNEFVEANLFIEKGKISAILKTEAIPQCKQIYDAKGQFVVPGFIDVHTHGAINVDVNVATALDLEKISHFFATQGTTSWLCSILTDTKEQTLWCIDQYQEHKRQESNGAELMGIHLEGPFLANEYKGAMPEHLLRKADIDLLKEYQEAAKGDILYITVSPEVEGVTDHIMKMVEMGMSVAIGHSGADYDTSMSCIKKGAIAATHTFNAMKLMHQHFPEIMGAVLESDIYCEAICDGRHLHPGVVRLLIKTKGLDKVIAVTDSIMATGMPDGNYKLGVNDVVVINGDAKLVVGNARAGSTLTTGKALKNILQFTQRPIEEIIALLTANPAKMLGIFDQRGSIEVSKYADLVVLDDNYDVVDTFVKGKQIKKQDRKEEIICH
ncbi:MAG: N-acetylglucosamine-6-phosphate deacetylase [Mobilitalea sp.]